MDVLTAARLMAGTPPPGWQQVHTERRANGFDANVWRNPSTGETVIGIRGVHGLKDVIGSLIRRRRGYDPSIIDWASQWAPTAIVGHSGGGGVASWAGAQMGLPTVTFASGRTRWAQENDGRQQTNVWIRGDIWGDPEAGYGMPLRGQNIVLEQPEGSDRHTMPSIVRALEGLGQ